MSSKKSKPGSPAGPSGNPKPASDLASPVTDRASPVTNNVSGRVRFDERGNAVWEWAVSTGSFGIDVSSSRLKKLENPSLAITTDEPPAATAQRPVAIRKAAVQDGYSPYDSGLLVKAQAQVQRTKRKDLKRLGEWLKLREMASRNKQDE